MRCCCYTAMICRDAPAGCRQMQRQMPRSAMPLSRRRRAQCRRIRQTPYAPKNAAFRRMFAWQMPPRAIRKCRSCRPPTKMVAVMEIPGGGRHRPRQRAGARRLAVASHVTRYSSTPRRLRRRRPPLSPNMSSPPPTVTNHATRAWRNACLIQPSKPKTFILARSTPHAGIRGYATRNTLLPLRGYTGIRQRTLRHPNLQHEGGLRQVLSAVGR